MVGLCYNSLSRLVCILFRQDSDKVEDMSRSTYDHVARCMEDVFDLHQQAGKQTIGSYALCAIYNQFDCPRYQYICRLQKTESLEK